jgi:hypothetical protein
MWRYLHESRRSLTCIQGLLTLDGSLPSMSCVALVDGVRSTPQKRTIVFEAHAGKWRRAYTSNGISPQEMHEGLDQ